MEIGYLQNKIRELKESLESMENNFATKTSLEDYNNKFKSIQIRLNLVESEIKNTDISAIKELINKEIKLEIANLKEDIIENIKNKIVTTISSKVVGQLKIMEERYLNLVSEMEKNILLSVAGIIEYLIENNNLKLDQRTKDMISILRASQNKINKIKLEKVIEQKKEVQNGS